MVIVKLVGGLGNQMFQYAAGKALSLKLKTDLKFTTDYYLNQPQDDTPRNLNLDVFNLEIKQASQDDLNKIIKFQNIPFVRLSTHLTNILSRTFGKTVLSEKSFYEIDSRFFDTTKDVYLKGYWNSQIYFNDYKDIIRKDFQFKNKPNSIDKAIILKMKSKPSAFIHVRRTDYLTNKNAKKIFPVCDFKYYEKAINILKNKFSKINFYVFSDDINWTRKYFQNLSNVHIVKHNTHAEDDLRLMSNCQHAIIANSTFSWWGAWLIKGENKTVIYPNNWFKKKEINKERTPNDWIKIN